MDVLLRPHLERFIADKVRDGEFADASSVVNAALEALKEQDDLDPAYVGYLKREIQHGIDDLDAGHSATFDAAQIIREERARFQKKD